MCHRGRSHRVCKRRVSLTIVKLSGAGVPAGMRGASQGRCDPDWIDNHRLNHATLAAPERSASIIRMLKVHDRTRRSWRAGWTPGRHHLTPVLG